jgi:5-methylcytosine-specific restriction endonuclease McrA
MTKTCTKCNHTKELSEFNKQAKAKDGHCTQCRSCSSKRYKNWHKDNRSYNITRLKEWHTNNKEHSATYSKERYNTHLKLMETDVEYSNEYTRTHSDYNAEWYEKNRESIIKRVSEYKIDHPERYREYGRKRRARKVAVKENYTTLDEQYTREIFNNRCANCGSTDHLHIDHHYPLSKGHGLTRTNAVVLCRHCNCSKSDKLPENFYSQEKLRVITELLKGKTTE